jgi:hypothetical protein
MLKLISNANLFAPQAMGLCHLLVAGEKLVYTYSKHALSWCTADLKTTASRRPSLTPGAV